jgi:hypothetical protein
MPIFEVSFILRAWKHPDWIRFPLLNCKLGDNASVFLIAEGVFLLSALLACLRRFALPASILASLMSVLLVNLDLRDRLQFDYLPAAVFLAFVFMEILKKWPSKKFREADVLVCLLGSIYAFASFHKLLNFGAMHEALPFLVRQKFIYTGKYDVLQPLCPSPDCLLLKCFTWMVVPVEASMAVLTFFRRTLKPRLLLVFAFHWCVAMVPSLWAVSFPLLLLHLYLATLQNPRVGSSLFKNRKWGLLLFTDLFFIAGFFLIDEPFFRKMFAVNALLLPVFFLFLPFLRDKQEAPPKTSFNFTGKLSIAEGAFVGYVTLLVLFGFSPLLIRPSYSLIPLGWTMFSGGGKVHFRMETPPGPCFQFPTATGVVFARVVDGRYVYMARRIETLEKLYHVFGSLRKCFTESVPIPWIFDSDGNQVIKVTVPSKVLPEVIKPSRGRRRKS